MGWKKILGVIYMAAGAGLWNKVKGFGTSIKSNSKLGNYVGRGVKWGAIGGAVGGTTEWAQGGSFFQGAAGGALTGASVGAGYTAFKAGKVGKTKARSKQFVQNKSAIRDAVKSNGGGKVQLSGQVYSEKLQGMRNRTGPKLGVGVKSIRNNEKTTKFISDTFGLK